MNSHTQSSRDVSASNSRLAVVVMAVIIVIGAISMTYLMHRSSRQLVASLDSSDTDTVTYSLTILKQRKDPAGIAKATDLLKNPSKDIQTNAALYLGTMGKSQSIPYLIQALESPDEQTAHEISVDLTMMTGVDFGTNFDQWNTWWQARHSPTATRS